MSFPHTTTARLEALSDRHTAYLATGDFMTCTRPSLHLNAYSHMRDAAIAAGFDPHGDDDCTRWVADRLADWRRSPTDVEDPATELANAFAALERATGSRIAPAQQRLYAAARAAGFDDSCQVPLTEWTADRINGCYVREAA